MRVVTFTECSELYSTCLQQGDVPHQLIRNAQFNTADCSRVTAGSEGAVTTGMKLTTQ